MNSDQYLQQLLEPGIILIRSLKDIEADADMVHALHIRNLQLSNGEPFVVLLDVSKADFQINDEAIKLLASPEFLAKRMATAIIVESLAARIIGNFFKRIQATKRPVKLFNNEEEAIVWLRGISRAE